MRSPKLRRVVVVLLAMWGVAACDRDLVVTQPIAFDHKAHIDSGLECSFCHEVVESAEHAGVPAIDTCMVCHESTTPVAGSDDCQGCHDVQRVAVTEVEKLQRFGARGEQPPWRRIYDLPDHVYFSHRRHVRAARIECVECHGDVAGLTRPAAHPLVNHEMDWCTGCHLERGASTDCIHCHR